MIESLDEIRARVSHGEVSLTTCHELLRLVDLKEAERWKERCLRGDAERDAEALRYHQCYECKRKVQVALSERQCDGAGVGVQCADCLAWFCRTCIRPHFNAKETQARAGAEALLEELRRISRSLRQHSTCNCAACSGERIDALLRVTV